MRTDYTLHCLNHVLKTRTKVLTNNERLARLKTTKERLSQRKPNSETPETTGNPIPFQSTRKAVQIISGTTPCTTRPRQVQPPRSLPVPTRHLAKPLSATSLPAGQPVHRFIPKKTIITKSRLQSNIKPLKFGNTENNIIPHLR